MGIGQASPQGDLHIGNISGSKDIIMHSANNGNARLRFREGGSNTTGFNEYSFGMVGNQNAMTWEKQGLGEIMRIDSSGRLLMGTSSTPAPGTVDVAIRWITSSYGLLRLTRGTTTPASGDALGRWRW